MRPTPYVASLRVYEPIESFEPQDQLRWSQISVTTPTSRDEQLRSLRRSITSESPNLKPDGVHILEHEGKRYVAPWSTVTRCWAALDFTHQAVLSAFGEGAVEGEVAELLAWLEIFNNKSIVELDYGGLATYLNNQLVESGEVGLDADTSIEDVTTSIAGLASGDGALAGRGYERLVARWRRVSSLESAT
ncbi:MAG: hypothetical protein EB000_04290 [Alphaproteobacteria bacterium]|nr:hypothetical protein [Alphaproteobacteria bacterium]